MWSSMESSTDISAPPVVFNGYDSRTISRKQDKMYTKSNWVNRRSNCVDRLQPESLESRLELYRGLETILGTDEVEDAKGRLKTLAPPEEARSSNEDSALGMSLDGGNLNEITTEPETRELKEEPVAEIVDPGDTSWDYEENLRSVSQNNVAEMGDQERADEFHAALGPEMDVVRQQIASILQEGPILFPLELISRLYLRYGRRLPLLYEGYSTKNFLAWLECTSNLKLDNLVFEF